MPIRKLVQLDKDGSCMEFDPVRIKREATAFMHWLLTIEPENDPHGFLKWDMPVVIAALTHTLRLPCRRGRPHADTAPLSRPLPAAYLRVSAPFYNAICAAIPERSHVMERDGKRYVWMHYDDHAGAAGNGAADPQP